MKQTILRILFVLAFAFSSPALFASGTGGGDSGGGDSGGGDAGGSGGSGGGGGSGSGGSGGGSGSGGSGGSNGDNSYSTNQGFYSSAYDKGKKIFMEQVVCGTCPFDKTALQEEDIEKIKTALERNGVIGSNLSYNQRYSVKYYVKKRFAK